MKHIIFYVLFLIPFSNFAQDSVACYFNSDWDETSVKSEAAFFRVGKQKRKRWEGKVRDYYISGKIQMSAEFKNDLEEGFAKYYYENGKISSEGNYAIGNKIGIWKDYYENGKLHREGTLDNGMKTGDWKYYYENGNLSSEGKFEAGHSVDVWKYYYRNGHLEDERRFEFNSANPTAPSKSFLINSFDSLGFQMVKNSNGNYTKYSKHWKANETGIYAKGLKEGIWMAKSDSSELGYTEKYENGKLIQGESWNSYGQNYTYTTLKIDPQYPGGIPELMKWLSKEIKYPKYCSKRGLMGKVYIRFIINKNGSVSDVSVERSVHPSLDGEALRVVKLMIDWKPAIVRGQISKATFLLPINFKIQ